LAIKLLSPCATIAIPQPKRGGRGWGLVLANPELNGDAAIDLDGFFRIAPSLAPLEPLFHKNQLHRARRRLTRFDALAL